MISRRLRAALSLAVGTALTLVPLSLLGSKPTRVTARSECGEPQAPQGVITVCLSGGCDFTSIQDAVDAADEGDMIKVAAGTYTGVSVRAAMTQVVYISRTVSIRGGYTTTDWTTPLPITQPTTLDAQDEGRVVSIVGDITPTLDGFNLTHGDATGLTTNCYAGRPDGCGGGIFIYEAQPIIVNNVISNNVAALTTAGFPTGTTGYGGGLCLTYADGAVISNNVIISNVGSSANAGEGGGIFLQHSDAQLQSNQVLSNHASLVATFSAWGAGVAVNQGAPTIEGNLVRGNQCSASGSGHGAGLYQWSGAGMFVRNRVTENVGDEAVFLGRSEAHFEGNWVVDNPGGTGVRLFSSQSGEMTLVNNVVAYSGGATLSAWGFAGDPLVARLSHNTLVGSGTGTGVYVENEYVTLSLTNTVVASHTWGITNTFPAALLSADHTLFWANEHDGIQGTNPVHGAPAFIDAEGGDYHIGPGSAAIDAGTDAGVTTDIDGDPRPIGSLPDTGADEAGLRISLPLVLRSY